MASKSRQKIKHPLFIAAAAFVVLFIVFWSYYSQNYNSKIDQTPQVSNETADWQTYISDSGYEVRYPQNLSLKANNESFQEATIFKIDPNNNLKYLM